MTAGTVRRSPATRGRSGRITAAAGGVGKREVEGVLDVVLIHGSAQSAEGFVLVNAALHDLGLTGLALDLPQREDLDSKGFVERAVDQVGAAGGADRPVVVAHSLGGVLAAQIAAELGARHIVWLAAYVPDFRGRTSAASDVDLNRQSIYVPEFLQLTASPFEEPAVAEEFMFHDCDDAIRSWALTTLRPFQPAGVVQERPPLRPDIPSTYVLPTADRVFRPEWMARVAYRRLGVSAVDIDTGHCPNVSRPGEIAALIAEAAK
ncbi:MAG: alpha/beta fold hydrolase [Streptosporangiales bacterium]|nr:alpha/beta fold hydrolase [Streptosporangiales bacterium]